MNRENKSPSQRRNRRVEISLRIRLLRSIIIKKKEQEEIEELMELEDDFIDDADIEILESHFKKLEFFLDSMQKPAKFLSVSSFDELCEELMIQPESSDAPSEEKRVCDETFEHEDNQENCDQKLSANE